MIDKLDNAMVRTIGKDVIDNTRTMAIEFEFFCHVDRVHDLKRALKESVTMTEKTYMQALRELPARAAPKTDAAGELVADSITWPTRAS